MFIAELTKTRHSFPSFLIGFLLQLFVMKKPELISPAGDLEKLKIAFMYGADAVYASTPNFSMRTREVGFDERTLKEGISYAHKIGKKVYLTINIFPHASEIEALKKHILKSIKLAPDAFIVADSGILAFIKANTDIPIHLSTQANTTNQLAASFWAKQGVKRIVLARELSLKDIKIISRSCHPEQQNCHPELVSGSHHNEEMLKQVQHDNLGVALEAFVHGAMCMAYSGRCQISNYLTGRDPNKGACVQACRFKYKMYGLEEDFRKGEIFPIIEDERGSYILNSKDLCMIDHVPELIEAGISSFKIEGRLKSIYYVGIVTRAYRKAIDLFFEQSEKYLKNKKLFVEEVKKTSNRGLTTGFYFGKPDKNTNNYKTSRAQGDWGYVGLVKSYSKNERSAIITVKNCLPLGSKLEIVTPDKVLEYKLDKMLIKGEEAKVAHAGYEIEVPLDNIVPKNSFVRMKF